MVGHTLGQRAVLPRPVVPAVLRWSLYAFLLLSSAAIVYAMFLTARTSRSLAEGSLESTAMALSVSAESALRLSGNRQGEELREALSDRVVAFALIADAKGKVLFHTNPARVGRSLEEGQLPSWLGNGTPYGRRVTLGTGLPAYEYNYVLRRPDGGAELLRLVIHTARADLLLASVRRMWWAVGAVLAVLWGVGVALERLLARQLHAQEEAGRRERLALIGQMTATLSHEIRNALGSVKGYTQWVDEKVDPSDPRKRGLAYALSGLGRIESLVNGLLQYSRRETCSIGPVDLRALAEQVILEETAGWGGTWETDFGGAGSVPADAAMLRRVLSNGVRNAIQAMGGEGTLRVSARVDGKRVRIRIEDTGPGIPESERERLFTPFHTTKADGTGLGLAYSRKAMEEMGGSIGLRNREGGGAVLEMILPMER